MKNSEPIFKLNSPYVPSGDQPGAINQLVQNINKGVTNTVLLGVTGSGKTFTVANVIQKVQRPALIISHNKTLAGQLFQEFRDFFPKNAVEYFVSYYDYYQPESYIPSTDTYIEKEADRNQEIDRLRLSATTSLSTRRDVIVVSSVSCIYNLGSPIEYARNIIEILKGMTLRRQDLFYRLSEIQYTRNDLDLQRSSYRVKGDSVDIHPSYEKNIIRLNFLEDKLTDIYIMDPLTGEIYEELDFFTLYPAKHYITADERREYGIEHIKKDLEIRLKELKKEKKFVEAYRMEQRTNYDLEMIQEIGYCSGIENYSRYFDGRKPGDAPFTLMDYFPKDYLLIIDESHITIPQIGGMYAGDRSRKENLVNYGFRLPSALDNRPLRFDEFLRRTGENIIYTSATPSEYELNKAKVDDKKNGIVELIVRPTGLIDPEIQIKPTMNQIPDLLRNIEETTKKGQRVLVTTLTKRMAEDLSDYLAEKNIKVAYLHSDIETLDRSDILDKLRRGNFDVLVGINLLREGLDLPEVSLVAILDADKEGFLRSDKSLIQTMGRAARHIDGHVIMYADKKTDSMKRAIKEVARRRKIQIKYNKEHNISPSSIYKPFREVIIEREISEDNKIRESLVKDTKNIAEDMQMEDFEFRTLSKKEQKDVIKRLENQMKEMASNLQFEKASVIRDKIKELKSNS
ncbi:excinuclease ABC subunit B [candidate division WWE3 bacterium CG10_big_fil_rev_8_21_14_0_10_32_10]|uniref:UvrABC system protein B n=1 Tax=candidate division WWE3 bacterium CG10_big_fil_rev_8_21_14_0_10_32_10 TaxID=1975090 RepID=A0A2H0RB94_UNCKA|nr:MAG: excinuclease ABC subunit B [candidate division WWE3 bacterium CG10_big_fil_rev_8_21_14_0_10_32_10]